MGDGAGAQLGGFPHTPYMYILMYTVHANNIAHVHTCTCMYMHIYICTCLYMHIYICTCLYMSCQTCTSSVYGVWPHDRYYKPRITHTIHITSAALIHIYICHDKVDIIQNVHQLEFMKFSDFTVELGPGSTHLAMGQLKLSWINFKVRTYVSSFKSSFFF